MSSYVLLRKLADLPLDKNAFIKVRSEKEEVLQRKRHITTALRRVLRRQAALRTCRLCMGAGGRRLLDPTLPHLADDLRLVLDMEVHVDDEHPQHACESCLASLRAAAEFKRRAQTCQWRQRLELEMVSEDGGALELLEAEAEEGGALHGGYFRGGGAGPVRREWKCNKCRKLFHTKEEFQQHEQLPNCRARRLAEGPDSYVCEVCGKEFKTKFRLKRHCIVHSTELKYACERCPYKARWPTALVHHMRVHNGERPVQCPYCPASFVTPSNLASHKRRHFPPQFKCAICQRTFTNKQGLQNHAVSQHSGVKAHHCSICGKAFSTRRLMRRHELKNHNCPKRRAGTIPVYLQLQQEGLHHAPLL